MIRPFGGKKTGRLADEIARARSTLAEALQSSEPDAFARALVREAWRLVPVQGLAWLPVSPAGITVGAQAPRAVIRPEKLAGSVVHRAITAKHPVRVVLRSDPALVQVPASVLVVAMRSRGETTGLLLAVRGVDEPFEVTDEPALEGLLRAAGEVLAQPERALDAAAMPPVALLRVDLFWAGVPSDLAREQAVTEAGRIIRAHIRPTDDLKRDGMTALEVTLRRPTPETVAIVSQRLHHALAGRVVELHNARWSINPVDSPAAPQQLA